MSKAKSKEVTPEVTREVKYVENRYDSANLITGFVFFILFIFLVSTVINKHISDGAIAEINEKITNLEKRITHYDGNGGGFSNYKCVGGDCWYFTSGTEKINLLETKVNLLEKYLNVEKVDEFQYSEAKYKKKTTKVDKNGNNEVQWNSFR